MSHLSKNEPSNRPPIWKMLCEAIEALGPSTTNVELRDWVVRQYPGTKKNSIAAHIISCSVNHPGRVHYPKNKKPRRADTRYDFLYRPARGRLERFDPQRHGVWVIVKGDDGHLTVAPEGGVIGQGHGSDDPGSIDGGANTSELEEVPGQFILESHLRDFVAQNIELVEPGLQLYVDEEADVGGIEYVTPLGRIDILALDAQECFVVLEFKVSRGSDRVCGQILRYMAWVKAHLAKDSPIRGFIIANKITDRLRYAASMVAGIQLIEYELEFKLMHVAAANT